MAAVVGRCAVLQRLSVGIAYIFSYNLALVLDLIRVFTMARYLRIKLLKLGESQFLRTMRRPAAT